MDHRAIAEARQVNETHDDVLRYVGGSISPEMEIPKLLWLKRHLPSTYNAAGHFFDLADYLSFRATGSTARSICTLTCKWNFLAHEQRWSGSYFERVGLGDLASDGYAKIGKEIVAPGTPLGAGLTKSAALRFRSARGDAGRRVADRCPCRRRRHDRRARRSRASRSMCAAGSPTSWEPRPASWRRRPSLASFRACGVPIIRGWCPASGSTKAVSRRPARPSIISSGPIPPITRPSRRRMPPAWRFWNFSSGASSRARQNPGEAALFARDVHVLPEFLGNRSPFADPDSRAVVAGMDLDADHRLDGAAVRGGTVRARLRSCRRRRCFSVARRRQRSDGDRRRRGAKFAGPPDHGGYDRPDRCAFPKRRSRSCSARPCWAPSRPKSYGSIGEAMASMSAIGWLSEPTAPGMADFHRSKRQVHGLMRQLDRESRDAMRGVELDRRS